MKAEKKKKERMDEERNKKRKIENRTRISGKS
jgi:hypothetical protein